MQIYFYENLFGKVAILQHPKYLFVGGDWIYQCVQTGTIGE
jgi:hypothetical protein